MAERAPGAGKVPPQAPSLVAGFSHVLALSSFAVTQPLLDLLAQNPTFFVAHRARPQDVVFLLLVLVLALPLLVAAMELVAERVSAGLRRGIHLSALYVLLVALVLPVVKRLPLLPEAAAIPLSVVLAGASLLVYVRYSSLGLYLTVLSPAVLVFAAAFLFDPGVRGLVFPPRSPALPQPLTLDPDPANANHAFRATTPLVLVIFDELPLVSLLDQDYQIDSVRYPNFAALARDATWFRNATTSHERTEGAIPALLTGKWVQENRAPTLANYPRNLFTLLASSYDLKVFEVVTQLAPREQEPPADSRNAASQLSRTGIEAVAAMVGDLSLVYLHILLPDRYAAGLPGVTDTWGGFWQQGRVPAPAPSGADAETQSTRTALADPRRALFGELLDAIEPAARPRLYFAHVMLPHTPWRFLPSGKAYGARFRVKKVPGELWLEDELYVFQGYQRHLLQLGYVDALVGQLVERLKEADLYDASLVVVTSDHGATFWPGDPRRETFKVGHPEDILRIPLFIKAPYQSSGTADDANVESVDLLPTLARHLGVELPWPVDGEAVSDSATPRRRRKLLYNHRGERWEMEAVFAPPRQSVERKSALFPDRDGHSAYGFGPHRGLVGKELDPELAHTDSSLALELDQRRWLAEVDLASPVVPVLLTGRIRILADGSTPQLAVCVNGRIEAVARSFPAQGGEAEFALLLPESALRQGRNHVEVRLIRGSPEAPRLYLPGG